MVHVGRVARRWGAYAAFGIVAALVLAVAAWLFHPRYPEEPSRDGTRAPQHAYQAGGEGCGPDRLRLLPNTPKANDQRARCAEAAEEEQHSEDTLSETRYSSDIAKQALAVAEYQGWAFFWQAVAAIAALIAASAAAIFAWLAIRETRRIGEAQTRAYVTVTEATITFVPGVMPEDSDDDVIPIIAIVAENAGDSPARRFVFNTTLQYTGFADTIPPAQKTRSSPDGWRDRGHNIPARGGTYRGGGEVPEDMKLLRFLQDTKSRRSMVMVVIEVYFEFTDVFGQSQQDRAYFSGLLGRLAPEKAVETEFGRTEWHGELRSIPTAPNGFVSAVPQN